MSTLFKPKFTLAFATFDAPVPPLAIATIPLTLLALPTNVPLNVPALTALAVITPAAKSVLPSLLTIVLATDNGVLFKAFEAPGMDETKLCTNAVVAICVLFTVLAAVGAVGNPVNAIFGAIVVVIEPEPDPVTAPVKVIEELIPELVNKLFTNAVVAI